MYIFGSAWLSRAGAGMEMYSFGNPGPAWRVQFRKDESMYIFGNPPNLEFRACFESLLCGALLGQRAGQRLKRNRMYASPVLSGVCVDQLTLGRPVRRAMGEALSRALVQRNQRGRRGPIHTLWLRDADGVRH